MEFNIQRCKVMHIGHNNPGYKYLMDNQYLQEVSDEKDLGIMVPTLCTPHQHLSPHYVKDKVLIEKIQRRFSRMIPSIRKLSYEDRLKELGTRLVVFRR